MTPRRRIRWLAGFAAAVTAGVVAFASAPAAAHASLLGSDPPNGAELAEPPEQVRLLFTENVMLPPGGVTLRDATGTPVQTVEPFVVPSEPNTVVLPVPADLPAGGYLVTYRVVSADSHPVVGALAFGVGAPAASLAGFGTDRTGPGIPAAFAVVRWLSYAGLALLAGGLVVLAMCWPAGWNRRRPRGVLAAGFAASLAGGLATLLLQGPYATGGSLVDAFDPALLAATLDTRYGTFVLIRLGLVLLAGGLVLAARREPRRPPARLRDVGALGVGLGLPATWTGTGHAAAGGPVDAIAEVAHVVAMMGWFGGLAMLAACLLPRSAGDIDAAEVGPALRRFSGLATVAVAVLVATGVYIAWRRVGGLDGLAGTAYGQLLAVKLAAIGVLLWLGALSRTVVRRRFPAPGAASGQGSGPVNRSRRRAARVALAQQQAARAQLHQSVRLEAVLATVVLAIAAVLVATPPGVVTRAAEAAAGAAAASTAERERAEPILTGAELVLMNGAAEPDGAVRMLVNPAVAGDNRVVIEVLDRRGEPWDVPEVRASFLPPAGDDTALPVPLLRTQPGVFTATSAPLTLPGQWRVRITVRTSDIDSATVLLDLPIQ